MPKDPRDGGSVASRGTASAARPRAGQDGMCLDTLIHPDLVQKAQHNMPEHEVLHRLSKLFKVFGDPTRIKILHLLLTTELCVCDMAAALDMHQSAISHQLRILRKHRLVKFRREGKAAVYSLADDHVRSIINQGMEHVNEDH